MVADARHRKALSHVVPDALAVAQLLTDHEIDVLLRVRPDLIHGRMDTASAPHFQVGRTFKTGEGALILDTTQDLIGLQRRVQSLTRALERAMASACRRINYGLGPFVSGARTNPTPDHDENLPRLQRPDLGMTARIAA